MLKSEANAILDRIREGYPMSLLVTTQALQRTGDIRKLPDRTLCFDGSKSSHDRAVPLESKGIEGRFSYSRYLDCKKTEGTQE